MKIRLKDIKKFQELLIKKGFSQRGLGRSIGMSESYASQIVNGERNPGPKTAKNICDVLEVEFDEIFFIDNASKSEQKECAKAV